MIFWIVQFQKLSITTLSRVITNYQGEGVSKAKIIPEGWEGSNQKTLRGGVWIFSRTTHYPFLIAACLRISIILWYGEIKETSTYKNIKLNIDWQLPMEIEPSIWLAGILSQLIMFCLVYY